MRRLITQEIMGILPSKYTDDGNIQRGFGVEGGRGGPGENEYFLNQRPRRVEPQRKKQRLSLPLCCMAREVGSANCLGHCLGLKTLPPLWKTKGTWHHITELVLRRFEEKNYDFAKRRALDIGCSPIERSHLQQLLLKKNGQHRTTAQQLSCNLPICLDE